MNWSKSEKMIARAAFDKAYAREVATLVVQVKQKTAVLVFGRLIHEGWLSLDKLAGLGDDKQEQLQMLVSRS